MTTASTTRNSNDDQQNNSTSLFTATDGHVVKKLKMNRRPRPRPHSLDVGCLLLVAATDSLRTRECRIITLSTIWAKAVAQLVEWSPQIPEICRSYPGIDINIFLKYAICIEKTTLLSLIVQERPS